MMQGLWQELRLSLRGLVRQPAFGLAAVSVLSLAIGANATLLGVVKAVLFRSPIERPDDVLVMWEQDLERDRPLVEVSYSNFDDLREESASFEDLAAFSSVNWRHVLTGAGEPDAVSSAAVSSNFFETLSVRPHLGRTFSAEDDEPGAAEVVVLSFGFWRERFGGDPDLVGRTIDLEGDTNGIEPFTVIGVMPRELDFPRGAEIWTPVRGRLAGAALARSYGVEEVLRRLNVLFLVGRLAPGVERAHAEAESNGILQRLAETHGWPARTIVTTRFTDYYLGGSTRRSILVLWGSVGLLLLVACFNLAGMLLVRASARARELAIRRALGASRPRIFRQVLLDGLWIGAAGGSLGAALATLVLALLPAVAPFDVPGLAEARLDGLALVLTTGIALAVGSASALLAAFRATPRTTSSPARVVGAPESRALHGSLVVLEVAAALTLILGAGLMARSLRNLYQTDLGYEPEGVVTFEVPFVESRRPARPEQDRFLDELVAHIASLPGVQSAAAAYLRPLETGAVGMDSSFIIEGQPVERETAESNPLVNWEAVTPGYFRTMGIRHLEGRDFEESDREGGLPVAIVGESLARRMSPAESAMGKRLWAGERDADGAPVWRTVVGVVEDARYRGLTDPRLDLYLPYRQTDTALTDIVVRASGDSLQLAASLRAAVAAIDPLQPVDSIITLRALVDRAAAPWRFTASLLGAFAVIALVLSLSGLFSVLAYSVSRRTKEIGVRVALGATAGQVRSLILRQGLAVVAMGLVLGVLLGLGFARSLSDLLHDVDPFDLETYALLSVLVAGAALAASLVPASRAARVDPMEALRHE
ncbi:MAG TPA: ABC transporter permease [Vicinamibacteria bacterium]|nr:ABC transporter permease [Vicinamibacteria bacterium]